MNDLKKSVGDSEIEAGNIILPYLADYHVHTYYSDDSECLMEDMVKRAIQLNLDEIVFTDHVDYGVKTDLNCDYGRYFEEIEALKKKYTGQLTIKAGIEFGIQVGTIQEFTDDFEKYDFDFIILSNHQIGNKEFWNYEFQKGKTQEEYQRSYYQAIYDVIKEYKGYSVLGHLDMIKRYDKYGDYPDEKIVEYVEPILKQVIADGKGIEVNTSSFKYGLNDLMPSKKILKLYRDLGGRILTIGSDTHETEHLADRIMTVRRELKAMGFEEFCTFERMEPTFHNL